MLKKYLYLFLIVVGVGPFEKTAKCSEQKTKKTAISIKTQNLESFDFYETISLIGKCEKENSLSYKSKICGTIDFVNPKQGNFIKKGETILIIDAKIAESIKKEAEAAYTLANFTHDANLKLYEENRLSKEKIIQSHLAFEQANMTYQKSLKTYNNMVIKAHSDGILGVIKNQLGDEVKEKDILFDITTDTSAEILVELPENFLKNGSLSNPIEIYTLDIEGRKIKGAICALSNSISDHGTVNMKVNFPKKSKLIHGNFVSVQLVYNKHSGLGVPEKLILKNNTGNFIYKLDKTGKAKQEYISLGPRTDNMIEIVSNNLKLNDKIISEGLTKVYDGADVEIVSNNS